MWRLLQFSYKNAPWVFVITLALTAFFGLQIPNVQIKVSADELIPPGSKLQKQYDSVVEAFGSDEVAVVYVSDPELFTRERLNKLKELNTKLKELHGVQRVESLFTVSNIDGSGGFVDTSPLLDRIPRSPRQLEQRKDRATSNPILLRNVISEDGNATNLTLYLRPYDKLAKLVSKKIKSIDDQLAALGASTTQPTSPGSPATPGAPAMPAIPTAPGIIPPAGIAPATTSVSSDIQAELLEERAELEKYLNQSEYAQHIYGDIEALLAPYKEDFSALFQIGSPAIEVQMKNYILEDQVILLPLSAVVLVIIIGVMLRSAQGALIPVLNTVIAAVWTVGAMALLGVPFNMLNYIVPALILVIGATEDVHLLVEYKEILARGWRGLGAITDVGRNIGLTLTLTGITTVLGFAATGLTDIKIMQDFGITAALGMFARFVVSMVFLPAYLRYFGKSFESKKPHTEHENGLSARATNAFTNFIMKVLVPRPYVAIAAFVLMAIPALYFASGIRMSNDFLSFLKPDNPIVTQLNTVAKNLSGTKVIYLTLEGNTDDFKQARKIQTIEKISEYLRETGEYDTVVSLADYLALVNREMNDGDDAYHKVPTRDDLLAQYLLFFHHSDIAPYVTGDYSRANIIIRSNINDSHHLNILMDELRSELDSGRFGPLLYTLTGKSVMISRSVDQLSRGQVASISFMAGTLFIIVAILFISTKAATLTVLSNLWAVIMLFGVMGLFNIPLNVGTCMVAAITIGIGIDDTLHLMVRYNKDLKRLKNELPAIERAVKAEFMPVIITSVGLAGGFAVLATSSFVPVMQFGALSALVIFLAVFADLVITPVLLSKTRLITLWDLVGLNLRKALMDTSPVFKDMNSMQAKKLILASNVQEYPAGTPIIKTGDVGDQMYVILDGELEVSIEQSGKRVLLSYLSMGQVFGEIALISKTRRTADVTAKTDTKLLVYTWDSLIKLRRYAPFLSSQLLLNLANILGLRLFETQRKLDNSPKLSTGASSVKRGKL